MPNDAKLGLLVGVAGVLAVAVMYAPKGATGTTPAVVAKSGEKAPPPASASRLPSAQAAVPADRASTPSMPSARGQAKPELEARPAGRK